MKKHGARNLLMGLICGTLIIGSTGYASAKVNRYVLTSSKEASRIIGSKGLILTKIDGKPGPLKNFRGFGFRPSKIYAYNKQKNTFEVDLPPSP